MSNSSQQDAGVGDMINHHRQAYLQSGGVHGHILRMDSVNGSSFGAHCLIRYKGRKSGKVFITPLTYGNYCGEVVLVASKQGADTHPNWYLNLTAASEVDFQIATQAFRATWREPQGSERRKIWDFMAQYYPFYAEYQAATKREIPIVMMKAIEEIPVFTEADMAAA